MKNTFLIVNTIYNEETRINIDHITAYRKNGPITEIFINAEPIYTHTTVEDLDQAFTELLFTVKKIGTYEEKETN